MKLNISSFLQLAFQKHRVHLNGASGLSVYLNCNRCISEFADVESQKCCFPWDACASAFRVVVSVQATAITHFFAWSLIPAQCFGRNAVKCKKCWWVKIWASKQNTGLLSPPVLRVKWQIVSLNKLQLPRMHVFERIMLWAVTVLSEKFHSCAPGVQYLETIFSLCHLYISPWCLFNTYRVFVSGKQLLFLMRSVWCSCLKHCILLLSCCALNVSQLFQS